MKQTAVEWLFEELIISNSSISYELFKQAKEMEKQQIIDAFKEGADDGCDEMLDGNEEQYYNETFKNK